MLDACARLPRPFSVTICGNRECGAALDRDAFALADRVEGGVVIYCDACADSATTFHPDRFKVLA